MSETDPGSPMRPGNQVVVVSPREIDVATAPPLRAEILAIDPRCTVVIDLRDVVFCDSSGLAVLIAARDHVTRDAGHLVLRNPPPVVRRLLEITQLTDVFEIEDLA